MNINAKSKREREKTGRKTERKKQVKEWSKDGRNTTEEMTDDENQERQKGSTKYLKEKATKFPNAK